MKQFSAKEKKYVLKVLSSGFDTSMVRQLEEKFSTIFESEFAIAFVNGTATMHAVLGAIGVGSGDEVIVPPLTFASTALVALYCGAIPVFADIDPMSWTINPVSIEKQITNRTKAIIPVSIYGLSPDMNAIMEIAEKHKLFVLEDNAECFLGSYKDRIVGTIGNASSFSFESSKHMTSGQGGMVITNDSEVAKAIRRFGALGYGSLQGAAKEGIITKEILQDPQYERHVSLGWNYLMSELCAAVALGQLERLNELVQMRKVVAAAYDEVIHDCPWLKPQFIPEGYAHAYWTYPLKLEHPDISWYDFRRKFINYGGDPIYAAWLPTYLEPVFRNKKFSPYQNQKFDYGLCPITENLQPYLLQFKTNYFKTSDIRKQAAALHKTIKYFN